MKAENRVYTNVDTSTDNGNGNHKQITCNILEWRSNSIFIFPKAKFNATDDNKRKILIGTDTEMMESNYVILLQCDYNMSNVNEKISIVRKYKHPGNVLNVIGIDESKCITASSDNHLYLYNLKQNANEVSTKPELMLNEHSKICTSISLNNSSTLLLSSSEDGLVCLWDLNTIGNLGILKPMHTISSHNNKIVNDVNWSPCNDNIFASGGNDNYITFYDKRTIDNYQKIKTLSPITKVAFNYLNNNLFISANGNNITDLWDLRNTKVKLHSFKYHKDAITAIKWSNCNENLFASASKDKSLVFWDIKLLEQYKSPVSTEDNPFEASLIHYFKEQICDIDWRDHLIGVVNIDNSINVMNQSILNI